jgi:hypothetical protein
VSLPGPHSARRRGAVVDLGWTATRGAPWPSRPLARFAPSSRGLRGRACRRDRGAVCTASSARQRVAVVIRGPDHDPRLAAASSRFSASARLRRPRRGRRAHSRSSRCFVAGDARALDRPAARGRVRIPRSGRPRGSVVALGPGHDAWLGAGTVSRIRSRRGWFSRRAALSASPRGLKRRRGRCRGALLSPTRAMRMPIDNGFAPQKDNIAEFVSRHHTVREPRAHLQKRRREC